MATITILCTSLCVTRATCHLTWLTLETSIADYYSSSERPSCKAYLMPHEKEMALLDFYAMVSKLCAC